MLKAARYARKAHRGQTRAHGAPYYKHPMVVARLLWIQGKRDYRLFQAAYLHDVLEDTKVQPWQLERDFGNYVTGLVQVVTKRPSDKARPRAYFERIKAHGTEAMALKLADRQHNNSEIHLLPPNKHEMRAKAHAKTQLMWSVFYGIEIN